MSALPLVRTCVLDGVVVQIDYRTGTVRAATGRAGTIWARDAHAVVAGSSVAVFGTEEAELEHRLLHAPGFVDLVGAGVALTVVLTIRECGRASGATRRIVRLLTATSRAGRRPATHAEATRAVDAVRWIAHTLPVRVACLEESAAAMTLLASRRRRVTWCHGLAPDPIQFHAWIETDGQPVAEPSSTRRFTALLTI